MASNPQEMLKYLLRANLLNLRNDLQIFYQTDGILSPVKLLLRADLRFG